jgi:hypothetical protein
VNNIVIVKLFIFTSRSSRSCSDYVFNKPPLGFNIEGKLARASGRGGKTSFVYCRAFVAAPLMSPGVPGRRVKCVQAQIEPDRIIVNKVLTD